MSHFIRKGHEAGVISVSARCCLAYSEYTSIPIVSLSYFFVFMICTSEVSHVNRFPNSCLRVCMFIFARANKFSIETSNSTHAITFRLLLFLFKLLAPFYVYFFQLFRQVAP